MSKLKKKKILCWWLMIFMKDGCTLDDSNIAFGTKNIIFIKHFISLWLTIGALTIDFRKIKSLLFYLYHFKKFNSYSIVEIYIIFLKMFIINGVLQFFENDVLHTFNLDRVTNLVQKVRHRLKRCHFIISMQGQTSINNND